VKTFAEVDLWEVEPVVNFAWHTWNIRIPEVRDMRLYIEVEESGMIQLNSYSFFNGKKEADMSFDERREVYEYLCEWELAVWRRIGPEDSELFATEKLDPEFGLEV
jgi:hypothetical protein